MGSCKKKFLCWFIPNCTRNHAITYTNCTPLSEITIINRLPYINVLIVTQWQDLNYFTLSTSNSSSPLWWYITWCFQYVSTMFRWGRYATPIFIFKGDRLQIVVARNIYLSLLFIRRMPKNNVCNFTIGFGSIPSVEPFMRSYSQCEHSKGVFTWHRGDFRAGASSLRFPLIALHLFTDVMPAWVIPVVVPGREFYSGTISRNDIM